VQDRGGDHRLETQMEILNPSNGFILKLKRVECDRSKSMSVNGILNRQEKLRYILSAKVIDPSNNNHEIVPNITLLDWYYFTSKDSFSTLKTKVDIGDDDVVNENQLQTIVRCFGLQHIKGFELICMILCLNEPEILSVEWTDNKLIDGYASAIEDCCELSAFLDETGMESSNIRIWATKNYPENEREDEDDEL
jgi:hypothetical protein